jgi:hypothetical protein
MCIRAFEFFAGGAIGKTAPDVTGEFPGGAQPELCEQLFYFVVTEFDDTLAELSLHQGTVEAVLKR